MSLTAWTGLPTALPNAPTALPAPYKPALNTPPVAASSAALSASRPPCAKDVAAAGTPAPITPPPAALAMFVSAPAPRTGAPIAPKAMFAGSNNCCPTCDANSVGSAAANPATFCKPVPTFSTNERSPYKSFSNCFSRSA